MCDLVSVVIPTYNRALDLSRAIDSVLLQTYSHWEIIIIDNNSEDGTDELINDYNDSRIKVFKINNMGVIAASRNLGVQKSSGDYVAFLDSDDWWYPEKLELSLKYITQGADVVYHDMHIAKKRSQKLFLKKARTRSLVTPVFFDLIKNGNGLNTSSVVVRKKILQEVGLMSEAPELIASEDYDAWLKIAKITEKFHKISTVLGCYWVGDGNYWGGASSQKIINSLQSLEKLYGDNFMSQNSNGAYWIHYAKGVTYFRGKNILEATKYLHATLKSSPPFKIYIKTKIALFILTYLNKQ